MKLGLCLVAVAAIIAAGIWFTKNDLNSQPPVESQGVKVGVSDSTVGSQLTSPAIEVRDLLPIEMETINEANFAKSSQEEIEAAVKAVDDIGVTLLAKENSKAVLYDRSEGALLIDAADELPIDINNEASYPKSTQEELDVAVQEVDEMDKRLNAQTR